MQTDNLGGLYISSVAAEFENQEIQVVKGEQKEFSNLNLNIEAL